MLAYKPSPKKKPLYGGGGGNRTPVPGAALTDHYVCSFLRVLALGSQKARNPAASLTVFLIPRR